MTGEVYEGASVGFRLEQKGTFYGPQDLASAWALMRLRNRSHHLIRNNAAAATAKKRLQSNWIGSGIRVRWKQAKMQKLWDQFCENPTLDGYGTMGNLQDLIAGALFESGEVFIKFAIRQSKKSRIPLKLQPLEAEMLDATFMNSAENVRYGIQFDQDGKPINYRFFQKHPREAFVTDVLSLPRVSVPAEDVLHIFQRERPGQWRGVPMLAPVMLTLYEMDELTDATLVRQKAAQAIGWIIKKKESGILPALGAVALSGEVESNSDGTTKRKKIQKILPGGIHYLEDDEEFEFASVDDIGQNLIVMLEHQWHMVAAALDLTYEQMTGDLSSVNFSSIRAGMIEFRRRCQMVQNLIFINLFLKPLCEKFKEFAGIYESASVGSSTYKFVLPKMEWVDPLKDVLADIAEVRAGFATLQSKLEERGEDYEEVLKQLATEQGLDLVLDSNPKKVTDTGTFQTVANQSQNDQPSKGKKSKQSAQPPNTEVQ